MTGGGDADDDRLLTGVSGLALEVKYLEPARAFYEETLGLSVRDRDGSPGGDAGSTDDGESTDAVDDTPGNDEGPTDAVGDAGSEIAFGVGETDLVLRRPRGFPRGGLHTHYALSIPEAEYDDWWDRLEAAGYDLDEATFGPSRSLYLYDPDGNCVELGQQDVAGPGIDGLFEIALEVEDLDRAIAFYADLGFEAVDRGEDRNRVRMHGPVALELWEPQLGIADARGGVHVDVGFEATDLEAIADAAEGRARSIERGDDELVVRDPDGHHLTVRRAD